MTRLALFLLGLLVGLAIAPGGGRAAWRLLRDHLASAIDAALRIGIPPSSKPRL